MINYKVIITAFRIDRSLLAGEVGGFVGLGSRIGVDVVDELVRDRVLDCRVVRFASECERKKSQLGQKNTSLQTVEI